VHLTDPVRPRRVYHPAIAQPVHRALRLGAAKRHHEIGLVLHDESLGVVDVEDLERAGGESLRNRPALARRRCLIGDGRGLSENLGVVEHFRVGAQGHIPSRRGAEEQYSSHDGFRAEATHE